MRVTEGPGRPLIDPSLKSGVAVPPCMSAFVDPKPVPRCPHLRAHQHSAELVMSYRAIFTVADKHTPVLPRLMQGLMNSEEIATRTVLRFLIVRGHDSFLRGK